MRCLALVYLASALAVCWARPHLRPLSHEMVNYINKANSTWTVSVYLCRMIWNGISAMQDDLILTRLGEFIQWKLNQWSTLDYVCFSLGWPQFWQCWIQLCKTALWNHAKGTKTPSHVSTVLWSLNRMYPRTYKLPYSVMVYIMPVTPSKS